MMTPMTQPLLYVRASLLATALLLPAGLQAQAPPPDKPTTSVDASRGGVTISSGHNSLAIGARMQFRWTLDDRDQADADTVGTGRGREDGAFSQFDIPRLRVMMSGGVYQPWLRYSFMFELSRTAGAGGSRIKDAIIEIRPAGRQYRFQMGQYMVPFGLQQLTSSGRQQFVDRAMTEGKFMPGRDMGVMLSGTAAGQKVGYQAGVFNGSGESLPQTNRGQLFAARVFLDPLGQYVLSESALDRAAAPVLHLGLGARTGKQIRGRTTAGVVEDPDNQTALNLEFAYKRARFFSTAEYFWMTEEVRNPIAAPDLTSRGFHAQAGYMIVPAATEVGIRYARVSGDADADDAGVREVRVVVGHFWRGHNLKLQADAGQIRYDAGYAGLSARARSGLPALGTRLVSGQRLADTQVRVQMQVAF
jgi:phosphate-selective porin